MDKPVVVVAEMKAKDGQEEELRRHTLALVEPTRQEEGCVQYDLHVSTDDPGRVVFLEIWKSREALDLHLNRPNLKAFLGWCATSLAEPAKVATYTKIA